MGAMRMDLLTSFVKSLLENYGSCKLHHSSISVVKYQNPWAQMSGNYIWITAFGDVRVGPTLRHAMRMSDVTIERIVAGRLPAPTGVRVEPETPTGTRYVA
jgi:hypothetical protein